MVLDLLKWLCQFNQSHPGDHVAFRGFDIQDPWKTGPLFHEFLIRAAPSHAEELFSKLDTCNASFHVRSVEEYRQTQEYKDRKNGKNPISVDANNLCISGITTIRNYLASTQTEIKLVISPNDLMKAALLLTDIEGCELEIFNILSNPAAYWNQRDRHMAQIFQNLRSIDGDRVPS